MRSQFRSITTRRLATLGAACAAMLAPGCSVQSPIEAFKREEIPFPPTVRRAEPPAPPAAPVRAQWQRIGTSVRGKPIEAAQFGDGSGGARRVYIIGGVRGDEPEAPRAAGRAADLLAAEGLVEGVTIRIVRDMNPDGTAKNTRTNTRGVDLTRNWPAQCFEEDPRSGRAPASELETAAVHRDMLAFKPDVVVVLSSSMRGPRVMYADSLAVAAGGAVPREARPRTAGGLAAPVGGAATNGPRLVADFAGGARGHDPRWRAVPERPSVSPGSVEALVAGDWSRAVLTVEFQRGRDESTNARALLAGLGSVLAPGR
jgi:murein peptide amidase A